MLFRTSLDSLRCPLAYLVDICVNLAYTTDAGDMETPTAEAEYWREQQTERDT